MRISTFILPFFGNKLTQLAENPSVKSQFVTSLAPIPNVLKNITIVFLPGTGIEPSEYEHLLQDMKYTCSLKLMNADIFTAKFTGNVMHRFEVDSIVSEVEKNLNLNNDLFIMGHSGGGVVGFEIAKKLNAKGVISLCGTFNSIGDLPWDSINSYDYPLPSLTLLAEHDKMLPFPIAVHEYCSDIKTETRIYSSILNNQKHLSSVGNNEPDSIGVISWKVSEFMASLSTDGPRSDSAKKYIEDETKKVYKEFSGLSTPNRAEISSTIEKLSGSKNDHHSVPPDMISTFFYIAFHGIKPFIHLYWLLPTFVFSQPSLYQSHSYSPLPDVFPTAVLHMPPVWLKSESIKKGKNRAMNMNKIVFEEALLSVSKTQRDRYESHGKKITFRDDFSVPKIPGCGMIWLMMPLILNNQGETLEIISPTIDIGSRINAKILSKRMCIEWITTKSFDN